MGVNPDQGVSASGKSPYPRDRANGVVQGILGAVGPGKAFAFYGTLNLEIWTEFATTLTTSAGSLSSTVAAAGTVAAGASIKCASVPPGTTVGAISGTTVTLALPILTYWAKTKANIARITDLLSTTWLAGAVVAGLGFVGTETVTAITITAIPPNTPENYPGVKGVVTVSTAPTVAEIKDETTPIEFTLDNDCVPAGTAVAAVFTGAAIGLTGTIQLERSFDGGQLWLPCNIGGSGALARWNTTSPISISFGEPEQGVAYRLNLSAITPSAGYSLHYRLSATGQAGTTLSVQTL